MDKLKQIDNILRKAAADMPLKGVTTSSDWNAIEQRLKNRKRRIMFMWSFLALFISSSFIIFRLNNTTEINLPTVRDTVNQNVAKHSSKDKTKDNKNIKMPVPFDKITLKQKKATRVKIPEITKSEITKLRTDEDEKLLQKSTKTPNMEGKANMLSKSVTISNQEIKHPVKVTIKKVAQAKKINSNKTENVKRWEYGISFTPSVSNKIVQENNNLSGLINRNYNLFIGNQEKSSFANNFGFNLSYHLSPKLFVSSGIYLTQRAEYLKYNYTITEFPIVTNGEITDYAPLNPLAYVDVNHVGSNLYHFIEIPLNFGFKQAISTNFEIRSQFGVSLLSLTKTNGKKGNFLDLQLENLSDLKFKKYNIATTIKSGLYFNKNRFNLGLEPSYSININSLSDSKTSALKARPYSYGINLISNIKIFKND